MKVKSARAWFGLTLCGTQVSGERTVCDAGRDRQSQGRSLNRVGPRSEAPTALDAPAS